MVVLVIGIISATAMPALSQMTGMRRAAAGDEVERRLVWARSRAMGTGEPTGVRFDAAGDSLATLRIPSAGGVGQPVPGPGGSNIETVRLPSMFRGVEITSLTGAPASGEVWFDFDGQPHERAADGGLVGPLSADVTVTLTGGGAVLVVALAIAVPPALVWLDEAASARADAANATRATTLATSVMESVLADVASADAALGFGALANPGAYVDAAGTGLRARLAGVTGLYEGTGFIYTVNIGGLVSWTGSAAGDPQQDLFRVVTVTASFASAMGATLSVSMEAMVTDL